MLEVRDRKTRWSPVTFVNLRTEAFKYRTPPHVHAVVRHVQFSWCYLPLSSSPPLGACSISVETYSRLHQWSTCCMIDLQNHPTECSEISELRNILRHTLLFDPTLVTTLQFPVTCAYCTTSLTILHLIGLLKICSMCLMFEGV